MNNRMIARQVWLIAGLLALLSAALLPNWWAAAWHALHSESIGALASYVRGFGLWAPAISLLLMLLQSVIAPLPGSVIAATNGAVFGIWWGTLLSWSGGLLGATASFWLARWLGQPLLARWFSTRRLDQLDQLSARNGVWVILIARLTPLVSFDFISYLAGWSGIHFGRFMLATAIGMAPGTFAWTALGHDLLLAQTTTWRISLLVLFAVLATLAGLWWRRHMLQPGATQAGTDSVD